MEGIRNFFGGAKKRPELNIPGLRSRGEREIDPRKAPRYDDGLVQRPDGKPDFNGLSKPRGVETREWSRRTGRATPASYTPGVLRMNETPRASSYTKSDFKKYFTDYANKIRPKGLKVHAANGENQAGGRTGGDGRMYLGGYGPNSRAYHTSPPVAVHELTHTMQPSREWHYSDDAGDALHAVSTSEIETPAVLAGSSVDALKNYHSGVRYGTMGLTPTEQMREKGFVYPKVRNTTMARQAAQHLYGKDIDTWKDTGPAHSMNEALDTRTGKQFIRRLGTPIRKSPAKDTRDDAPAIDYVLRGDILHSKARESINEELVRLRQKNPGLNWDAAEGFMSEVNPEFKPSKGKKTLIPQDNRTPPSAERLPASNTGVGNPYVQQLMNSEPSPTTGFSPQDNKNVSTTPMRRKGLTEYIRQGQNPTPKPNKPSTPTSKPSAPKPNKPSAPVANKATEIGGEQKKGYYDGYQERPTIDLDYPDYPEMNRVESRGIDSGLALRLKARLALMGGATASGIASLIETIRLEKAMLETPKLENISKARELLKDSGLADDVPIIHADGEDGAAYMGPRSTQMMLRTSPLLAQKLKDDAATRGREFKNVKDLVSKGMITMSPEFLREGIILHEGGHANIRNQEPFTLGRINQRFLRPAFNLAGTMSPLIATAAGGLAGRATGGNALARGLVGGLAGAGTGLLLGAPELINERQATNRAIKGLENLGRPEKDIKKERKALGHAFNTYLVSNVVAPAVTGGLSGMMFGGKKAGLASGLKTARFIDNMTAAEAQEAWEETRRMQGLTAEHLGEDNPIHKFVPTAVAANELKDRDLGDTEFRDNVEVLDDVLSDKRPPVNGLDHTLRPFYTPTGYNPLVGAGVAAGIGGLAGGLYHGLRERQAQSSAKRRGEPHTPTGSLLRRALIGAGVGFGGSLLSNYLLHKGDGAPTANQAGRIGEILKPTGPAIPEGTFKTSSDKQAFTVVDALTMGSDDMDVVGKQFIKRMVMGEPAIGFNEKLRLMKQVDDTSRSSTGINPSQILGPGAGALTGYLVAKSRGSGPIATGVMSGVGALAGHALFKPRGPEPGDDNFGQPGLRLY
mgnify:CR=1 FL=1